MIAKLPAFKINKSWQFFIQSIDRNLFWLSIYTPKQPPQGIIVSPKNCPLKLSKNN